MKNVFLFGLAGAGKDTVADILFRDYDIRMLALADPIREEYVRFIGKADYKQNRETMIRIGEGYKTIYGQDIWCNAAMRKMQARVKSLSGYGIEPPAFGIIDGRYQHEYDYFVRQHGFVPLQVVAPDHIRLERLKKRDGSAQDHALYVEKQHFISDCPETFYVRNETSVNELRFKLETFVNVVLRD